MNKKILEKAIEKYGIRAQEDMFIEESAELIKAVLKFRRLETKTLQNLNEDYTAEMKVLMDNITEEIADVEITIAQLKIMFDCEKDVEEQKEYKLNRLKERMEE